MSNPVNSTTPVSASSKDEISSQLTESTANVHETVCIQADVKINPVVTVGEIESFCVGGPNIGACSGLISPTNSCTFAVSQNVCIEIPLTFSALAIAEPTGIVCGTPLIGPCPVVSGCTFTIGYFKNHPDVTNALITKAGGSIILGVDNTGSSYTVTIANANNVLSFMTPSPPAPASGAFAQQYQNLYAQLLAANLNVINGATCDNAKIAISNANSFLETSPSGVGKAGAPLVQAPLENFNAGTATGCPGHCP